MTRFSFCCSTGFSDLSQDDQLVLIKCGFSEIWLVRLARLFNPNENTITFGDGSVISRDQIELTYSVSKINNSGGLNNFYWCLREQSTM
jgi:hypothetical protein